MKIKRTKFGVLSTGEKLYLYTVKNKDMSFSVTNFGCIITSIVVPSKSGKKEDVVLGYSDPLRYVSGNGCYFGACVGRFANRIKDARFTLNGKTYNLDVNDNANCLHSGFVGYDKMAFDSQKIKTEDAVGVRFTRVSKDGEQGFPGNLSLEITYLLNRNNEISLTYRGATDADTPVNLTNHSYFNLSGNTRNTVFDHELTINADSYLEVDKCLMPTGKRIDVASSEAFDFRKPKKIGKDFAKVKGGYDHNYCINRAPDAPNNELTVCASVYEPTSGRSMIVSTNQPGVQFYAGNSIGGNLGKLGQVHEANQGFCLETQQFPDAPNIESFPSCIVKAGETFEARTVFGFSWK